MNPVAGGCTFYRFDKNNGKMYILLQHTYKDKKRSYYEDIGGRMEPHDLSIYHTITREINEETNGQFGNNVYERLISPYAVWTYNPSGKYIIFYLQADEHEQNIPLSTMDTYEYHSGYERTFHWICLNKIHTITLSPRLPKRIYFPPLRCIMSSFTQICGEHQPTRIIKKDDFTCTDNFVFRPIRANF